MSAHLLVWYAVLFMSAVLIDGKNPGLQARVTVNGLNYANKVAMESLASYITKATIPDQSGKSGIAKYEVTGMHVTSFSRPSSSLMINPGKGLTWSGHNAGLNLNGNFKYKVGFVKGGGSFDVTISGLSFSIGLIFGVDNRGRPKIAAGGCSSDIGSLSVKFHGGASWFYNLFKKIVANKIKDSLKGKLCSLIVKEIDSDAEKKLSDLPVLATLDKVFLLDYRLLASPNFNQKYMETYHKGEIYWAADCKTEAPVVAPPLPTENGTVQMFYIWMSDYLFNSLAYVAQKNRFLRYNLTTKDLPSGQKGALNTTCKSIACIGNLIPQIGKMYPNSVVELDMFSSLPPHMKIDSEVINVTCGGVIQMYARTPEVPRVYLLTLNASMSTTVQANITNEILYGKIEHIGFHLDVVNSSVGTIEPQALQFVIDTALKMVLMPKLNELGARGFPLPVTKEIKFINTKLTLAQNAMVIATDLKFKSLAKQKPKTSKPLMYQPHVRGKVGQFFDRKENMVL